MVNYEIIVVDGASNDGIAEIAQEILKDVKESFIISEEDNGIYDAMNKGIEISKGEYLLMLNGGDYLYDEYSLSFFFTEAKVNNQSVALGRCIYHHTVKDNFIYENIEMPKSGAPELCHQTLLYRKKLHDEFGYYNDRMKSAADYDFFSKLKFLGGINFVRKDRFVVVSVKNGNDASCQLQHALDMTMIDIKTGVIIRTWPKRFKSIISRILRFKFNKRSL